MWDFLNLKYDISLGLWWKRSYLEPPPHPLSQTHATRLHQCSQTCQKGSAAMLTSIQSAGVAPEVNLRNTLCAGKETRYRGNPPWLWNPGQMSPEVQNRGISSPTKEDLCPPKILKKQLDYTQLHKWSPQWATHQREIIAQGNLPQTHTMKQTINPNKYRLLIDISDTFMTH